MVFAIAGVVFLFALYFFLGRFSFKYSQDMRKKFESYQAKLQEGENLIRSLPDPGRSLEDIGRKRREFRQTSGPERQLPKIIQVLGQSAAGKQINILSIRPREDIKAGVDNLPAGVTKLFIEMTLSGYYQELGEYIKILCELPGVFTIETMTIKRASQEASKADPKSGVLNAELIVSTYVVGDI